jgi:hypothetical protein
LSRFDQIPVMRAFTEKKRPSRKSFALNVDTGSSLYEAFVIDSQFNLVARGQGNLKAKLPEGEYLLRYRAGDSLVEKWIQLDHDLNEKPELAVLPPTVAPISERTGWTDAECIFAETLRSKNNLSVVIRDPRGAPPPDDVRILGADGKTIARLVAPGGPSWQRNTEGNVIGMAGNVIPGPYMIQVSTPEVGAYAMALWVAPQCATQVFMERRQLKAWGRSRKGPHLASASIFIAAQALKWPDSKQLLALSETAKSVLSYDRPIVPSEQEINRSLDEKYRCPILGLLAGHLLRLRYEKLKARKSAKAKAARSSLETVVANLKHLMPDSPDVVALEFALGLPAAAIATPPMLAHSWAILEQLGYSAIPLGSYADRIHPAISATRPWLVFKKSKMKPRLTGKSVQRHVRKLASLPPALQEAVRQLDKRFAVDVDGEEIVLRRNLKDGTSHRRRVGSRRMRNELG